MPAPVRSEVVTNDKKGSVHVIKLQPLRFDDLWREYPRDTLEHIDPKTGNDSFSDHCAIHLSESLRKCGVGAKSFKGARCWNCPSGTAAHILRAQDLADWLSKKPFIGCPSPVIMTGGDFKERCENKTGIIFFKDYWQREGEKGTSLRTGDHIDFWKDGTLAGGGFLRSFARITLGLAIEGIWSDFKRSTQVRFWEIK